MYLLLSTPTGKTMLAEYPELQAKLVKLIVTGKITTATLSQLTPDTLEDFYASLL